MMGEIRFTIKSWAKEDRPREKLINIGRSNVTDAELLGILIGSGNKNESAVDLAKKILASVDNNLGLLGKLTINDLKKFKGIGAAKAIAIISALELGRRRRNNQEPQAKLQIKSSKHSFDLMRPIFLDKNIEEFWIVLLNRSNHVIAKKRISTGGMAATIVDPKVVFKVALDHMASSMIAYHNHPSRTLKPSKEDIALTQKLKSSGELIDIKLLDHLIIVDHNYFSFADEGLI